MNWSYMARLGSLTGALACAALPQTPAETVSHLPLLTSPPAISPGLTGKQRLSVYLTSAFGPSAYFRAGLSTAYDQWRDYPAEWGQGTSGISRRFSSKLGRAAIDSSLRHGVAALRGEDPRYFRSQESGVWNRTRHAVVSTFVVPTDGGGRTLAVSRFVGAYGGAFISHTWYPDRYRTTRHSLESGSISIGLGVGKNLLKEFWPDIRKLFH